MSGVGTVRRYMLLKERERLAEDEDGLALAWRAKRQEYPATDLPSTFPSLAALAAATPSYTAVEDLKGPTTEQSADIEELVLAGLSRKAAAAVIAALEEL